MGLATRYQGIDMPVIMGNLFPSLGLPLLPVEAHLDRESMEKCTNGKNPGVFPCACRTPWID